MVNLIAALQPLVHWLVKTAGLRQQTVEIEPGTVMSFWVPKETLEKKKESQAIEQAPLRKRTSQDSIKRTKPVVVLVHGFAGEGLATWQFQIGALTKKYALYVPDLLFFGGSETVKADRSPEFQAECLVAALGLLGVEQCTVAGFSYGGMVAFKMAEARPDLVKNLVISGSVIAMTDSISEASLERLGFSSSTELLLPESVRGLKALFSVATYKNIWFPDRIYRDFLEVMFNHRKERKELLEGLVISNKDAKVPNLQQRILLLWGENDNIFNMDLAQNMREQLGDKAKLQHIKKAGHLVHLERPCAFNHRLKEFLALVCDEVVKL